MTRMRGLTPIRQSRLSSGRAARPAPIQAYLGEVQVAQVDAFEYGAAQVGTVKSGALEVGVAQVGLAQV